MLIRKETPKDYEDIYKIVKKAFASAEHADGNEQDLVNALRTSKAYIPDLSLVADADGKVVGHIMFTKAEVAGNTVLVLAPLSVLPAYQRKGIGKALIMEGHKIAERLGYPYSVVLGSETYYSKLGYVQAAAFGIHPPIEVPRENFMAYQLNDNASNINGILRYAKEFGID